MNSSIITLPIATGSSMKFSGVRIENLGATEYTLVSVTLDRSSSVGPFAGEIVRTMKTIVEACRKSPRADNLLLRVLYFNEDLLEVHGFKPLATIDLSDYDHLNPSGCTALYDAAYSAVGATVVYARELVGQDFNVNGITFTVTDGEDNRSRTSPGLIADLKRRALAAEEIESLQNLLIGVNIREHRVLNALVKFEREAELDRFIDIGEATTEKLAKLAAFISKSISAQSRSLGTGGGSTVLTF